MAAKGAVPTKRAERFIHIIFSGRWRIQFLVKQSWVDTSRNLVAAKAKRESSVLSVLLILFLAILTKLALDVVVAGTRMLLGVPFRVSVIFEPNGFCKFFVNRFILEFDPLVFHIILGDVIR